MIPLRDYFAAHASEQDLAPLLLLGQSRQQARYAHADLMLAHSKPKKAKADPSMVPTTDIAKRVAAIQRRGPDKPWNEKEFRAYQAAKITEDDLKLVEQFYRSGDQYLRRDLLTLLNNWNGEVDRARAAKPKQPTMKLV